MQRIRAFMNDPVVVRRVAEITRQVTRIRQPAKMAACVIGSICLFTQYGYTIRVCKGASMLPTLSTDEQCVIVDKRSYCLQGKSYNVDDVVVCIAKDDPNKKICKRVTGVTGDTIVHVHYSTDTLVSHVVGPGQVWLSGDNPLDSSDSREYGTVPIGLLLGRVLYKMRLRPPRIECIDHVSDADKIVQKPVHYYTKSYNLTRTGNLKIKDWQVLCAVLKSDKHCVNISPHERKKLLQLAEHKLQTLSKGTSRQPSAGTRQSLKRNSG